VKAVITTLGTSLLRHYFSNNSCPDFLNLPYSDNNKKNYINRLKELEDKIFNWFDSCEKSAESATLCQMLKDDVKYKFYFIASDSLSTYLIGNVLKRFFKLNYPNNIELIKIKVAKDLSMENIEVFQKGISNLLDILFNIIKKESKSEIYFNITGGYKGVIPYFSTIAQIFDCKIIYDFEGEKNRLITISALPVEFDRSLLELFYPYLALDSSFNNLEVNSYLEKEGLLKDRKLTPLGKIAKYAVEEKIINRSTLGYIIEFVLYEYFWEKKDKIFLNFPYKRVEKEKKINNSEDGANLSDIDIMLENGDKYIWIEVKPISNFYNLSQLKGQFFKRQLKAINVYKKRYKKSLFRYVIIFYGLEFNLKEANFTPLRKFKREMKFYGIEATFYYLNIPIALKEKILGIRNYQKLLTNFKIEKLIKLPV
jgi:hypothetical protein